MREIWLLPNRRIFALGMVFPVVVTLLGLMLIWQKWGWIWGLALSVAGLSLALLIAWQMSVPRLAHRGGELLVYLRVGRPLRLPLEFVECFFLSSGAGQITTARGDLPVRNLVLRIAERATEYQSSGARRPTAPGRMGTSIFTESGASRSIWNWCRSSTVSWRLCNGRKSKLRRCAMISVRNVSFKTITKCWCNNWAKPALFGCFRWNHEHHKKLLDSCRIAPNTACFAVPGVGCPACRTAANQECAIMQRRKHLLRDTGVTACTSQFSKR